MFDVGTLSCSLELWCFELIVILAGLLPNPEDQVSAMTVCFNTTALCFMLPLGLSTAVRCATPLPNHPGYKRREEAVKFVQNVCPVLPSACPVTLHSLQGWWTLPSYTKGLVLCRIMTTLRGTHHRSFDFDPSF